jgi:hypothetical protein
MNAEEIVKNFIKCQTEKQIERTYYILVDCKNDLINDIEYSLNYNKYLVMLISTFFFPLYVLFYTNGIFKPLTYIMKKIYNSSLYLVGYYKDDTHDRLHKLENTIENIESDLNEFIKVLDNKFFNEEYVKKLSYDREILNIKDRLTILENQYIRNNID